MNYSILYEFNNLGKANLPPISSLTLEKNINLIIMGENGNGVCRI